MSCLRVSLFCSDTTTSAVVIDSGVSSFGQSITHNNITAAAAIPVIAYLTQKGSTFRFFSDEAALSAASSRANTSSMICEGTDSSAFSSIDLKALSNSLYPFVFIVLPYLVLQYRTCPVQLRP